MNLLHVYYENRPIYDITFASDYTGLQELLLRFQEAGYGKVCFVYDSNTAKYYQEILSDVCHDYSDMVFTFIFPAGEQNKNLNTVYDLYKVLIQYEFCRNDLLVAVGGGVTGDLTGFVAATYLRGISFVQAPTSLLAMVDSSIGGKTGVDFQDYKNMIGAFHQPSAVYMNLSSLKTLENRQFFSGMAEIIKHSLICDANYVAWLEEKENKIKEHDYETLKEMIYRSCEIKKSIVERDPNEKGERALLNFGHTIGHAVEKLSHFQLLHGECVSIGIAAACSLSVQRGLIHQNDFKRILSILTAFHLPICTKGMTAQEVLEATGKDKKRQGKEIKFILLTAIGQAYIDTTVSEKELWEAAHSILE